MIVSIPFTQWSMPQYICFILIYTICQQYIAFIKVYRRRIGNKSMCHVSAITTLLYLLVRADMLVGSLLRGLHKMSNILS